MTPTIALIAVSLIAAGLCVAVGIMQWRISALKADATYERYRAEKKAEHFEELLIEAKAEADNEYELRRQAERNLAEANKLANYWAADSAIAWHKLKNYSRQRDPKTGRFYSAKKRADEAKKVIADAFKSPDVIKRGQEMAAFDAMMGNAIEQLQGLTVRKLCDEVKENASAGI